MNYQFAYAHGEMNPKKRHTMEDVHRVQPILEDCPLYSYFGVYDGEDDSKDMLVNSLAISLLPHQPFSYSFTFSND
jgi:hypothetical protein